MSKSEEPEVAGIWPEVGGKQLPIMLILINIGEHNTITFLFIDMEYVGDQNSNQKS